MPFHHGFIRIGILAALRICRIDNVVDISDVQRASRFGPLDDNGFIDLPAIFGQFECSAHPGALRTLFVRHKLASVPVRRNFLIIVCWFLQLAAVRIENKLVEMLIGYLHLSILQGNAERAGWANLFL